MPIQLTAESLRKVWGSRCPQSVIDAFVQKRAVLDAAGITETRTRLSYALTQVDHETNGFALMVENLSYTAEQLMRVWPKRFPTSASTVGFIHNPKALGNKVYNGRMGNRVGSDDGFNFRGHGGPQITGREAFAAVERLSGVPVTASSDLAASPMYQPEMLAAVWTWKGMNRFADVGDFRGCVRAWNGGEIGMADRQQRLAGNAPFIARLEIAEATTAKVEPLPGGPSVSKPPKPVIDKATEKERRTAQGGAVVVTGGGAGEVVKPDGMAHGWPSYAIYGAIGLGVAILAIAVFLLLRKRAKVFAHWR